MSESLILSLLLALSGGFQDAYTYIERGHVFANAQTGNVVLMSASVLDGNIDNILRYINPLLSVTSENGISYLKDCYSSVSFIRKDPHDRVVVNGVALLSDNAAERAKSLSMEERVLVSDLYHEMSRLQMKDAQDVYSAVVVQVAYNLRKSYPVSYRNDLEGYIRDNCSDFLESIEEKVINDLIETDDCNPDVDAITYRAGAIVDDLGQEYEKELAKIAVALLTAEE